MRRVLQALCILVVGCGLCHLWTSRARAAETQQSAKPQDPGVLFDRLDTDHKGVLSAEQIPADKRSLFERLLRLAGKPADGQLTRAEFVAQLKSITDSSNTAGAAPSSDGGNASAAGGTKPLKSDTTAPGVAGPKKTGLKQIDPEKLFDRLDKKHVGKLAVDDVPEPRQKFFKRLLRQAGKPATGSLTKEEFVAAVNELMAKRDGSPAKLGVTSGQSAAPDSTGNGKKAAFGGAQAFDVDAITARLMKRSSRPDGKLTKTDLPEKLQSRFDKIDANHDGLVDEPELRAWLNKVKRRLAADQALGAGSGAGATASSTAAPNKDNSSGNAGTTGGNGSK